MEHKKGRRFGSLLGYLTQTKATTGEKQLLEEKITEFTQIVEQVVKSNQELNKKVSDLIHLLSVNDHTHHSEGDSILVPQSPTYFTDDEICSHNPGHETLVLRGTIRAHTDSITAIAIPLLNSDIIVTASRDKSIIVWKLDGTHGVIQCQLTGHSHSVQDVALSFDGRFVVSASWDGELRLWELATATTIKRFVGHTEDVMSVALSVDTRYIVSASRDCSIKLWNTLGECHYTFDQEGDGHSDWVTCVRLSPKLNTPDPIIVSASCDNTVKIWSLSDFRLRFTLQGHKGCVNAVAISPDQTLCASGGKDATIMLWDLEEGSWLRSVEANSTIHALCFSHTRYWICAATETSIQIWDLESKSIVADLRMDPNAESDKAAEGSAITLTNTNKVYCTSLSWSYDGNTLFSGYTDGVIRVWVIERY